MATTQIRGTTQIQDGTIADAKIAAAAAIQTSKLQDGAKFVKSDGTVTMTAALNMGSQPITNLQDPTNPQDAATRAWVLANVAGGVVSSTTVMVASTGNLTLSGTQTVDSIALSAGNSILVKDQASQATNGIYAVTSGAWTRLAAMDAWTEVPGMLVSVQQGTVNHDTVWLSTADAGGTLNTTAITFTQLPGPSDVTAGAGLTRTGQVIDVVAADNSVTVNADSIQAKLDPARAITVVTAGIGINIDSATMAITGNALGVKSGTFVGASNFVVRETPTGAVNGSNVTFTLANAPLSNTECVYLNGLLQEPGANDYSIATNTITFVTAPATGDRLRVNYQK